MSRIFDIADDYIDQIAAMQPIVATYFGVPGHETEMPDNSPDGDAAQAELDRSTLAELKVAESENRPRPDCPGCDDGRDRNRA